MADLKPCPFCGRDGTSSRYGAGCKSCGMTFACNLNFPDKTAEERDIERWNTRVDDEASARDSKRYRVLREGFWNTDYGDIPGMGVPNGADLDAIVDAHIKENNL